MRIAVVQGPSPAGATEEAAASLRRSLAAAASGDVRVAVFPERCPPGCDLQDPGIGASTAEEWDTTLGPLAAEGDLASTGGSCLVSADDTVLAEAGLGPALLIADLMPPDPTRLSRQSRDFRPVE